MRPLLEIAQRLFARLSAGEDLYVAFARIAVGWMYCGSGWRKLHNLEDFVALFERLGIPAPSLQAPFVATLEFVGGLCLALGLGSRVFGGLLASTMVVAILTDRLPSVNDLLDFLYLSEWLLLLLLGWFVFHGGGRVSLDRILGEKLGLAPPKRAGD